MHRNSADDGMARLGTLGATCHPSCKRVLDPVLSIVGQSASTNGQPILLRAKVLKIGPAS